MNINNMKGNAMSKIKELSTFISLILRHKPEVVGIKLDKHGWANVNELIKEINNTGKNINSQILDEIVRTDNKQRYSYNEDKTLIRANQGHSIPVDVKLKEVRPPEILYHGTATRFIKSILQTGLKPMNRLYVHLSKDINTATKVGSRHGEAVVLKINSEQMHNDGITFYLSENGVWLTKFIYFLSINFKYFK